MCSMTVTARQLKSEDFGRNAWGRKACTALAHLTPSGAQSIPISAMPGTGKKSNRPHDEGIVPRPSRGRSCREQLMLDDSHTWYVAPSTLRKPERLSAQIQLSPVGWLPPHSALLRFATETVLWGTKGEEGLQRLHHVAAVPRDTHPRFRGTQSTSSLPVTSRFLLRYQEPLSSVIFYISRGELHIHIHILMHPSRILDKHLLHHWHLGSIKAGMGQSWGVAAQYLFSSKVILFKF